MQRSDDSTAFSILCRQVPRMEAASGLVRGEITSNAAVVRRVAGTVLFDEGSHCGGMLLLDRGLIRVSKAGPRGRELTLYRVSPTQICVITLSCVLACSDYPARGVVERDIEGVLLPVPLFTSLTGEVPEFRAYVFDAFSNRLAELIDLASAVTFEHLDKRLAAALLRQCEARTTRELMLTHQDLASELGTVRERVSRLLEDLEARGVLELARGRIHVLNCEKLREIVTESE
ncbi:MAG: Crp/Fnr family transcriptional regulator [Candidatus Eisenbacteria bacterium]|nr:Crp/Fnr family transcriptional regulator [Candidatus Eisenbacteria bacterium]